MYENQWVQLTARSVLGPGFSGDEPYYALEQPDYVHVLALTPDGEILMVRQYRPAVETFTMEFPSGHVEPGETPEQCAKRELQEETGYTADRFELLGRLNPDTGRLSNTMWCFSASGVTRLGGTGRVPEVALEPVRVPLQRYLAQLLDGSRLNCMDLATLMMAASRGVIEMPFSKHAAGGPFTQGPTE